MKEYIFNLPFTQLIKKIINLHRQILIDLSTFIDPLGITALIMTQNVGNVLERFQPSGIDLTHFVVILVNSIFTGKTYGN